MTENLAAIYVWLRYSSARKLTWQRNYNTQPRILGEAQRRLTEAIAQVYIRGARLEGLVDLSESVYIRAHKMTKLWHHMSLLPAAVLGYAKSSLLFPYLTVLLLVRLGQCSSSSKSLSELAQHVFVCEAQWIDKALLCCYANEYQNVMHGCKVACLCRRMGRQAEKPRSGCGQCWPPAVEGATPRLSGMRSSTSCTGTTSERREAPGWR